jgi:hypothetical protein
MLLHGFPQGSNHLGCQMHPPRPVWCRLDTVEFARLAPVGDRVHRDIRPRGCGLRAIPAVSSLALGTGRGALRTPAWDVIGVADPVHLTGGEGSASATGEAFRIQTLGDLSVGVGRRQRPYASHDRGRGSSDLTRGLRAGNFQRATGVGLPADIDPDSGLAFGEASQLTTAPARPKPTPAITYSNPERPTADAPEHPWSWSITTIR